MQGRVVKVAPFGVFLDLYGFNSGLSIARAVASSTYSAGSTPTSLALSTRLYSTAADFAPASEREPW